MGLIAAFGPIWILTAIGYLTRRRRLLADNMAEVLGQFVFHLAIPADLFLTLSRTSLSGLAGRPLAAFSVSTVALMGAGWFAAGRWFGRKPGERAIWSMAAGYVNSANLGIPIATRGARPGLVRDRGPADADAGGDADRADRARPVRRRGRPDQVPADRVASAAQSRDPGVWPGRDRLGDRLPPAVGPARPDDPAGRGRRADRADRTGRVAVPAAGAGSPRPGWATWAGDNGREPIEPVRPRSPVRPNPPWPSWR